MAASSTPIDELNILLVGDIATGKYCYTKMLQQNIFPNDTRSKKEYEIIKTKIRIDQDTEIPIKIINISGSQRGKTKIKELFKNIDGYIIMFDVSHSETFDNVIGWKKNIDTVNNSNKLPSLLLANKCDLEKDEGLQNLMDVMDNYREAVGFSTYFEISVRDNINIERSIQALIKEIIERKKSSPLPSISSSPPPSPNKPREYRLKILVIGEVGTGKTAFIQRYVNNTFSGLYRDTIGSDLAVKKIQYSRDTIVNLHFWDIAGGERFGTMTQLFYRDAAGCLIVFDVSRPSTLTNGVVKWKEDFDSKANFDIDNPIPCLLIGNKRDLKKEGMAEDETQMEEFCRKYKFIRWFETSAKENTNIAQSILFLIQEMLKKTNISTNERRPSNIPLPLETNTPKDNSVACCPS